MEVKEWKVWSVLAHGSSDACLVMAGYGPLRFCCWTRDVKLSDRMSFWQMSSNLCLEEDQTLKGVGCSFEIDQKEWMKQKGRMAWTHLKPLRESEKVFDLQKFGRSDKILDCWSQKAGSFIIGHSNWIKYEVVKIDGSSWKKLRLERN